MIKLRKRIRPCSQYTPEFPHHPLTLTDLPFHSRHNSLTLQDLPFEVRRCHLDRVLSLKSFEALSFELIQFLNQRTWTLHITYLRCLSMHLNLQSCDNLLIYCKRLRTHCLLRNYKLLFLARLLHYLEVHHNCEWEVKSKLACPLSNLRKKSVNLYSSFYPRLDQTSHYPNLLHLHFLHPRLDFGLS
jgi:hypothetical protein